MSGCTHAPLKSSKLCTDSESKRTYEGQPNRKILDYVTCDKPVL
jgi:hypothetical protein